LVDIIVLLKDIIDVNEVRIDPDTEQPKTEGVKRRISELDKRALEAAIKIKESTGGVLSTLSMGGKGTRTAILEALAMGADSSFIINDEILANADSLITSKVLKAAIEKIGKFDIILGGEMTLDRLSSQVVPRLAELLDLPQVTYVKKIELIEDKIRAVRDLEDMDEVIEVSFPAIISVVREINEPRIPSLMNIMKAKRKPTEEWDIEALGISTDEIVKSSSVRVIKVMLPKVERKRIIIKADTIEEAASQLADAIIAEGVLEL
jgi:electron transfer flavoprotein beta subunit